MATSNFQTQKSFPVLLSISVIFFLLLINKVSSTETLSFSFPNFVPNQPNLIFQNDSIVTSSGKLQLTKVANGQPENFSLGRALYSEPIHIWERTTGNVASFVTSFSFIIKAPNPGTTADGLVFFLAPMNTQPKSIGGYFGIFDNMNYDESYQTVAVEFDTFRNPQYDPQCKHIGIDVNQIRSIKTAQWDFANGQAANVVIRYEASTKSLTASLVYPSLGTGSVVSAIVDLKGVLPEWVRIGFSAYSGTETHDILSWSFESKLPDSNCDALENNAHDSM